MPAGAKQLPGPLPGCCQGDHSARVQQPSQAGVPRPSWRQLHLPGPVDHRGCPPQPLPAPAQALVAAAAEEALAACPSTAPTTTGESSRPCWALGAHALLSVWVQGSSRSVLVAACVRITAAPIPLLTQASSMPCLHSPAAGLPAQLPCPFRKAPGVAVGVQTLTASQVATQTRLRPRTPSALSDGSLPAPALKAPRPST